jgi:hypothetical protein
VEVLHHVVGVWKDGHEGNWFTYPAQRCRLVRTTNGRAGAGCNIPSMANCRVGNRVPSCAWARCPPCRAIVIVAGGGEIVTTEGMGRYDDVRQMVKVVVVVEAGYTYAMCQTTTLVLGIC